MLKKKTADLTVGESIVFGVVTTIVMTAITVGPLMVTGALIEKKQKKAAKKA
jgi:hypothetical protein